MAKAGDFVSRWNGAQRRRKIVGRRHCRAGAFVGSIALWKAEARSSTAERIRATRRQSAPSRLCRQCQKAIDVLRCELAPHLCAKRIDAERAEILVEVTEPG